VSRAPEEHLADADPLSETMLIGTPYRPVAWLGRGGMGEVVEAEHIALGKPVVVKLLHKDLARQPQQVERMRVEAQSLARLAHPNLVMVTDFGLTPEGRPYLVMERLQGHTLKDELAARGAIPVAEAVDLTRQILAGLSAAHGLGLVHRDVKLENLFICDADANGKRLVKVLDFGIAKVVPGAAEQTPAPSKFPTAEGVLLGTPRFLSPEQAMGKPVDARTDVYSTGMVLYTLLCGRGPFQDITSLTELLRAHAYVEPDPPSKHAKQAIPAEIERVVAKALAKKPEDRFQDASSFAAELGRALEVAGKVKRWQATEPLSESDNAKAIAAGVRAAQQRAALQAQSAAPQPPPPPKTASRAGPTTPMRSPTPLPGSAPAVSSQGHVTPSQVRVHVDADPAQAGQPTQAMTVNDARGAPVVAQRKPLARTAPLGDERLSSAVLPFRATAKPARKSAAGIVILIVAVLGALALAAFVAHRLRLF
jgi:serine/threonine-protein kinase